MAETRTIRTVLELNAQRFNRGAASAAASAKALSGELAAITDATGKQRQDYDRVANSLLGIGAAAATGLGLASKAAMDWESSWAGVTKTVDGTPEQLQAVEDGLRGLARELPASHQEIAAVAEAAGQLGVQTDSVVEFTRTMINLGETTNLSAEEAATGLARFSNIMGTSQDDVDRLGSAIVGLGNNYATTEGEILAMSMRLAGTGSQLELSEGEVLGLATAMSSVGIEAEAGGTAMSMGMRKIEDAVREGGDALSGFAEVAGMSNDEFARLWNEDSAAGLDAFVQGLSRVSDEGGDVAGVLADLGIKGIRESDTFLRLAGAADLLSSALEDGNTEFERNLALTEEAAKRYETTESQLQIARNAIVDAGVEIGAEVLPVLADVAENVADLAGWFSALPDPVKTSVAQLGGMVAVTGLVAGGLMKVVPAALDTVTAFRDLRTTSPQAAKALGRVGKAAGIASVAFAATSALSAYGDSLNDVTITANEAAGSVMKLADGADPITTLFDGMYTGTQAASASTKELANDLDIIANGHWYAPISDLSTDIQNAFGAGLDTTGDIRQRLEEIGQGLAGLYETDLPAAQRAFTSLHEAFGGTDEAGLNLLETMPALRDQLAGVANEAGLDATDQMVLLKLATGELVPVMDEATGEVSGYTDAQSAMEDSTSDSTDAVQEQVDALDALQGQLDDTANLLLGVRGSEREFEAAIDDATAALEENGKTLDEATEAGRENEAALDGIAEATHRWADDALEAGASAEELDAIMERGREQFIKTAEDMGMSEEAAADLADQLGLMPEFVETEVSVKTEQAREGIDEFLAGVTAATEAGVVNIDADTGPAEEEVAAWNGALLDQPPGYVPVTADTAFADEQVEAFYATMMDHDWEIEINGETVGAEQALDVLVDEINAGEGTVMINGVPTDAETALLQLISHINGSGGTVEIDGDAGKAWGATDSAVDHANSSEGTIDVDANTWGANAAIDAAARTRTAYINVVATGATSMLRSGLANIGRAEGGWLNEGLNAGGWVPGPYPGPGVDNVLWPVRSGLADGGLQMQPLAGTEFVVNGASAKKWGPALEAINSGMSRSEVAAMIGAGQSSQFSYNPTITGPDPVVVADRSFQSFKHWADTESTGVRGA